ncbi:MAG: hypothetical protein QOC80_385 [Frankiaceae bacterium]|jgi:hypothetical protein|nr:hypothetical protein [Frankiaceae bacterium]
MATDDDDQVAVLRRWTDSGAIWRVLSRTADAVEISLRTCSGGEEVDRIRTADPSVLAYLGDRWASDDGD